MRRTTQCDAFLNLFIFFFYFFFFLLFFLSTFLSFVFSFFQLFFLSLFFSISFLSFVLFFFSFFIVLILEFAGNNLSDLTSKQSPAEGLDMRKCTLESKSKSSKLLINMIKWILVKIKNLKGRLPMSNSYVKFDEAIWNG